MIYRTQIKRGDAIIKNMNKFAHSVDEEIQEVRSVRVDRLDDHAVRTICIANAGSPCTFNPFQQAVVIRTRPFLLEFMIWNCIQIAMERCGETRNHQYFP